MNLMSIVNINEDRKERKAVKNFEKAAPKRDYGYSVYEALEYGSHKRNDYRFNIEILKSLVR
jgi:hypothetical protein